MATVVFTPSSAIRGRAQPGYPVGTKLCLSNFGILRRGAVQRGSTLKSEAHKGQRNSNSDSNLNSNVKEDEEREAVKSIVERITASVRRTATKPPLKSRFPPRRFDPKEKGDNESSGDSDFSNFFVKSTKNDDEKNDVFSFSSKSVSKGDNRSSKPLSNFDNLIKEDDKINSTAPKQDFKPSRPPSKFVRKSPIPNSISRQEPSKTIPLEEQEKQEEKPFHMIFSEESSENIPIEEEGEESSHMELHDKLEELTVPQLRKISKERGLKGYSQLKKAELVKLLMGKQV